jgi:hypothetical protein
MTCISYLTTKQLRRLHFRLKGVFIKATDILFLKQECQILHKKISFQNEYKQCGDARRKVWFLLLMCSDGNVNFTLNSFSKSPAIDVK